MLPPEWTLGLRLARKRHLLHSPTIDIVFPDPEHTRLPPPKTGGIGPTDAGPGADAFPGLPAAATPTGDGLRTPGRRLNTPVAERVRRLAAAVDYKLTTMTLPHPTQDRECREYWTEQHHHATKALLDRSQELEAISNQLTHPHPAAEQQVEPWHDLPPEPCYDPPPEPRLDFLKAPTRPTDGVWRGAADAIERARSLMRWQPAAVKALERVDHDPPRKRQLPHATRMSLLHHQTAAFHAFAAAKESAEEAGRKIHRLEGYAGGSITAREERATHRAIHEAFAEHADASPEQQEAERLLTRFLQDPTTPTENVGQLGRVTRIKPVIATAADGRGRPPTTAESPPRVGDVVITATGHAAWIVARLPCNTLLLHGLNLHDTNSAGEQDDNGTRLWKESICPSDHVGILQRGADPDFQALPHDEKVLFAWARRICEEHLCTPRRGNAARAPPQHPDRQGSAASEARTFRQQQAAAVLTAILRRAKTHARAVNRAPGAAEDADTSDDEDQEAMRHGVRTTHLADYAAPWPIGIKWRPRKTLMTMLSGAQGLLLRKPHELTAPLTTLPVIHRVINGLTARPGLDPTPLLPAAAAALAEAHGPALWDTIAEVETAANTGAHVELQVPAVEGPAAAATYAHNLLLARLLEAAHAHPRSASGKTREELTPGQRARSEQAKAVREHMEEAADYINANSIDVDGWSPHLPDALAQILGLPLADAAWSLEARLPHELRLPRAEPAFVENLNAMLGWSTQPPTLTSARPISGPTPAGFLPSIVIACATALQTARLTGGTGFQYNEIPSREAWPHMLHAEMAQLGHLPAQQAVNRAMATIAPAGGRVLGLDRDGVRAMVLAALHAAGATTIPRDLYGAIRPMSRTCPVVQINPFKENRDRTWFRALLLIPAHWRRIVTPRGAPEMQEEPEQATNYGDHDASGSNIAAWGGGPSPRTGEGARPDTTLIFTPFATPSALAGQCQYTLEVPADAPHDPEDRDDIIAAIRHLTREVQQLIREGAIDQILFPQRIWADPQQKRVLTDLCPPDAPAATEQEQAALSHRRSSGQLPPGLYPRHCGALQDSRRGDPRVGAALCRMLGDLSATNLPHIPDDPSGVPR